MDALSLPIFCVFTFHLLCCFKIVQAELEMKEEEASNAAVVF
jgi:hypothetical protein